MVPEEAVSSLEIRERNGDGDAVIPGPAALPQ
jgi:hypothetical protein